MFLQPSLLLLISLLNADEEEVLVWGDKDFLSLGTNSEEGHIVHRVDVSDDAARLESQIGDMVSDVLRGGRRRRLVSLGNDSSLIIHN